MMKKKSITTANTEITALCDIIQRARIELASENSTLHLSADDTRKIVLACLLLLRMKKQPCFGDSVNLSNVLEKLNVPESMFLQISERECRSVELKETIKTISLIQNNSNWQELLNYAFETLEYAPHEYFDVNKSRGTRRSNSKKKNRGIYYTPADVVNFMVSKCIETVLPSNRFPSILDCSCGSGAFLIQSFLYLEKAINPHHNFSTSLELLSNCLWGVDISPAAIDCCKIVFIQYYLDEYNGDFAHFPEIWHILDHSLFVGDATKLQNVHAEHPEFPEVFDCIVGNPPYVSEGKDSNLFIPFVDNMMVYSSKISCSAIVLPLSICYSQGQKYTDIRKRMQADAATWAFLNYDRSPDSLFGDQVKTRNTILFRSENGQRNSLLTTTLQRWTSEYRDQLFTKHECCDISDIPITRYVPKISNILEKQVYNCINHNSNGLKQLFTYSDSSHTLVINGTAYNWICAYDHIPPSTDEQGREYLSNTAKVYNLSNEIHRDFCIAVLSNRIAYWYWVVIGDGFHLNSSFLSDLHISWDIFSIQQQEELCRLGKAYSQRIKEHATVSFNAGKRIVNYSHWEAMDIIRRIEEIIIDALNLPSSFASHIEQWYYNQVYCNRNNEKR